MLGLDGYGSGSESESENESQKATQPRPPPVSIATASNPKFNLPPASTGPSDSKLLLPPPKSTKRAPKKITIGLPTLLKDEAKEEDDLELEKPAPKRQKTSGAGASGLLSMLPAPKQKAVVASQPERILGAGKGPGLVFNTRPSALSTQEAVFTEDGDEENREEEESAQSTSTKPVTSTLPGRGSLPFLPPSLVKGKANISLEDKPKAPVKSALPTVSATPAVDFFSIGDSKTTTKSASTSNSSFSIPALSSAPSVPTFEPPEPTPQDQYPGYYQLPSGQWAAYEPDYYEKFRRKWQSEYNVYIRGLEKGTLKGFEGYEENASEVDAMKEMEKAKIEIKAREERKALTKGATAPPAEPKMKLSASKQSGIAKSRNQLSTLLRDAYANRETLEEKIAEGRRNRKEAGNKYGF